MSAKMPPLRKDYPLSYIGPLGADQFICFGKEHWYPVNVASPELKELFLKYLTLLRDKFPRPPKGQEQEFYRTQMKEYMKTVSSDVKTDVLWIIANVAITFFALVALKSRASL
jgi:hypothetical protein